MKQYKIIACDLDGTLLNSKSQISKENLNAIDVLSQKGVHFVPTSGRTICEIPKVLLCNDKIRYIIGSNGAVVFDKQNKNKILTCIEKEDILKIYDIILKYNPYISFRYNGKVFADANQQTVETLDYYNVCGPHRECMKLAELKIDVGAFLTEIDFVEVFALFFHTNDDRDKCQREIMGLGNLSTVKAWDCNLEIFNKNTSKGTALEKLAKSLNVDICETIAVGDSENDISMLKTAGLGLAMGNSTESVRDISNEIICNNDSNAIDYILKNYFSE